MPRTAPPDRLTKLLDAAAAAFVEHGFHRTQMDDIADRLGVSKGTVYRSVDSKDALFAAVVRWGDKRQEPDRSNVNVATNLSTVAADVAAELTQEVAALELAAIVAARRPIPTGESFTDELDRVTLGLYRILERRRTAVMVLDRCAGEIPELATIWFGDGRYALVDLWAAYLTLRSDDVTTTVDVNVLARTIVEILTTWAVKMPWDPAPRPYPPDPARACAAMICNLVIGEPR